MNAVLLWCAALLFSGNARAAEWRQSIIPAPGPVAVIEVVGSETRVAIGEDWYRVAADAAGLDAVAPRKWPAVPSGALPDSRVAVGTDTVARAWLAEPVARYAHGVLGDAIEAGSLVIERRDDQRLVLRLAGDAVFEDLVPRIVTLDGAEHILVVKSYLNRGSALAVVDARSAAIVAETPPIGRPHAWLNPAGAADFDGDGSLDIALVRQPHVLGRLELWSWRNGSLEKIGEITDVSNHVIGSRALGMSVTADFDGDGRPDIAVPSLDRRSLRLIGFVPQPREIARVPLPARITTNLGLIVAGGRMSVIAGLETGELVAVHD